LVFHLFNVAIASLQCRSKQELASNQAMD